MAKPQTPPISIISILGVAQIIEIIEIGPADFNYFNYYLYSYYSYGKEIGRQIDPRGASLSHIDIYIYVCVCPYVLTPPPQDLPMGLWKAEGSCRNVMCLAKSPCLCLNCPRSYYSVFACLLVEPASFVCSRWHAPA